MKKKYIFIAVISLAVIGLIAFAIAGNKSPEEVELGDMNMSSEVLKRDIVSKVNVSGNVFVTKSAELKPEGKAYVTKCFVKLGQEVKKGDILVEMDYKELEKSLERKKFSLDMEKEKLRQIKEEGNIEVQQQYDSAKIDFNSAESKFISTSKLYEEGAASKKEYDSVRDDFDKAKMALEKARVLKKSNNGDSKIKMQELTVKSVELEIKDILEKIEKRRISSPFDGTITDINFSENELYDESKYLIKIQNMDSKVIETLIPESEINKIFKGQKVKITSNGIKSLNISGSVDEVYPSTIKKSGKNIAYTKVIIAMEQIDNRLREGFTVNLSITVAEKINVLSVESEALKTDIDGNTVITKLGENGQEERISVITGAENSMYTEILEGNINEGDKVILNSNSNGLENMDGESMGIW